MLTLSSYWMGRHKLYPDLFTDEIQKNGRETVNRISRLLDIYRQETGDDPDTWSSGWRPPQVNGNTKDSAGKSNHIKANAGDVQDKKRNFAKWCLKNLDKLELIGLWMEDPRWTPTWVHLQTLPPKSGKRVYIPSAKPPLAPAL